jgi:hypothetical protein
MFQTTMLRKQQICRGAKIRPVVWVVKGNLTWGILCLKGLQGTSTITYWAHS